MNILMMTNTYRPFVGGVKRSVETFTREYRKKGHRVIVVAPTFKDMPEEEEDVIRIPAIQNFNGTDFSVRLPIPGVLSSALKGFRPQITHSHHPYLLGDTALRVASKYHTPLVFTFHTFYERYTHYVPGDSPALKRFVIKLSTEYANLCNKVFAPSESVARELYNRGVTTPTETIPTGIDVDFFSSGDGSRLRNASKLPPGAPVVGFVSRIAPEKNMEFLANAVSLFLQRNEQAHFFVIGSGPSEDQLRDIFRERRLERRLHTFGTLEGKDLVDAYHAMDLFAFASQTETQGMVITEAMAAGLPVVAVDAPGVREVVEDSINGRLLAGEDLEEFSQALEWVADLPPDKRSALREGARQTAERYSKESCASRALEIYSSLSRGGQMYKKPRTKPWEDAKRMIRAEWDLLLTKGKATGALITGLPAGEETQ